MDNVLLGLALAQQYERLRSLLTTVFEYGHTVFQALLESVDELQSNNVSLRGKYRESRSKQEEICHKAKECIDVIENHPACTRERQQRIFDEIDGSDSEARLDLEKNDFPNIADFLRELGSWLDNVQAKLKELSDLRKIFDDETKILLNEAEKAEHDARKWKKVSLGVAGTSVMVAGAGAVVLLGGGPQLSGGVLCVGGGSVALWSYLAMGWFEEQKSESYELKVKLDRLNQDAKKFGDTTRSLERKMHATTLTQQHENIINRPHPFIRDFKTTYQIIFETFEEKYNDFEEEKNKIREMGRGFSE